MKYVLDSPRCGMNLGGGDWSVQRIGAWVSRVDGQNRQENSQATHLGTVCSRLV